MAHREGKVQHVPVPPGVLPAGATARILQSGTGRQSLREQQAVKGAEAKEGARNNCQDEGTAGRLKLLRPKLEAAIPAAALR